MVFQKKVVPTAEEVANTLTMEHAVQIANEPRVPKERRAKIGIKRINNRHITIITKQLEGLTDTKIAKEMGMNVFSIYNLNSQKIFQDKREEIRKVVEEKRIAMLAGQYKKQGDAILEQAYPEAASKLVKLMRDESSPSRIQQLSAIEIKESVKAKQEKNPSITIEIPDGMNAALQILMQKMQKKENADPVIESRPVDVKVGD